MPELAEISRQTVDRWIGDGEAVLADVREANEWAWAEAGLPLEAGPLSSR